MDYTTLTNVKLAIGGTETTDDTLLGKCITAASRAIDRHCAAAIQSDDYFKLETVTAELGEGIVDHAGGMFYRARKPLVAAVTAFAYRLTPGQDWIPLDTTYAESYLIRAWPGCEAGYAFVRVSYSGGLAATADGLPADLVDAATVLAVRMYKETKTGLSDSIGVAELGTLTYTKALPTRVVSQLAAYRRVI